jgi:hypothetical protein
MNWKPMYDPKAVIPARFAPTSRRERRMPSRTSGAAERRSTRTNSPSSAAASTSPTRVRADAQPTFAAFVTV